MTDMASVTAPKSDQINADDLISGPMIITVTGVQIRAGEEQPVSIQFRDSAKVYRPCKSMSRVLMAVWGADAKVYAGRSLKLYRDPDVTWGGLKIGGIRISEMTDMKDNRPVTMALTATKKSRALFTVKPLVIAAIKPTADMTPAVDHLALATAAAHRGTEAFRAWYVTAGGKAARDAIAPFIGDLKSAAAAADAAMSDDPFGLPPLSPTADDMAHAEQAAREAAQSAAQE